MKKEVKDEDIKKQRELEKRLSTFMGGHLEINKENLNVFKVAVQKDFFVERLLYINNKLFKLKEKIAIDQIINNGGVIIPYKQGVETVTLNQRVGRLEDNFEIMQKDMKGMQTQINGMQTQMNNMHADLSNKIDKLTNLLTEHIKNHK